MNKKNPYQETRNQLFDLLRIILTFLVVNLHIRVVCHGKINILDPYAYFAVPIFMALSFFLTSKYFSQIKLPFSIVALRIKRLALPLIFWSAIGFLLKPNLINIRNIFLQLFTGKVVDTPLYYLNILICFTIIFWLITYLSPKYRVPLYVSLILISIILEYSGINTRLFNLTISEIRRSYGQIVELIKYASLGMLLGIIMKQNNKRAILFGLVLLNSSLLLTISFPQPWGYNYSGLRLFLGTVLVLSSILLIGRVDLSEKVNKTIHFFGTYSFGVYLCHIIFFETLFQIFPKIRILNNSFPFQFLFIYTFGCYVFCIIFDIITHKKYSFLVR